MAFIQHTNTMEALLVQARELNRQICELPGGHPKIKSLQLNYASIQSQIRTLRGGINQQTWL